jgi:ferredoxin
MLFIDPEHCIDCEACVFECPVEAIFHEDDVPEPNKKDVQLNARMAKVFPSITERKNE